MYRLDGRSGGPTAVCEMGPVVSSFPGCGLFLLRRLPEQVAGQGFDYLVSTLAQRPHEVSRTAAWEFTPPAGARRGDLPRTGGMAWAPATWPNRAPEGLGVVLRGLAVLVAAYAQTRPAGTARTAVSRAYPTR